MSSPDFNFVLANPDACERIEQLEMALEQIAIVCTDNMDRDCNHRMALDFVRQVANDTLSITSGDRKSEA